MKIITAITTLLAVCAGFSAAAQEIEIPDTVKVIDDVEKVVVTRSGNTTFIKAQMNGASGSETFSYKVSVEDPSSDDLVEDITGIDLSFISFGGNNKGRVKANRFQRKLRRSFIFMEHAYIGQRFNYFDKGNVKNSVEFGVRNIIGVKWSHGGCTPEFSIGLGMSGQRYSAVEGFAYSKEGSKLVIVPIAEGVQRKTTHFNVFTVQIPLMFTQPLGGSMKFMAGGIACLNSYAWCTTKTVEDKVKQKTVCKGLQQRLFTAEAVCALGVCDVIGVYASWSPMTLFQQQFGPQLKSWSIGATIGF
ncbi:MAG: hypothetical protein K2G13_01335 [Muribaculaceae bacterium]|nr:hypothetical protein [Muribaculaceae bacterium]